MHEAVGALQLRATGWPSAPRTSATFLGPLDGLDCDEVATRTHGRIRAELERRRTLIGGSDLLLAAQALAHGHIVVTRNVREFERVAGLQVVHW
ncbi:MAG: hypothetical protein INH41_24445 [Myxococcaceae bacterium]|nr:hypothetical protein [Myxococcaceae bacterium]